MLKRLELAGFKSFADKTAFEFGHGITVVVGPNGSGKSNVVDGIRWVMGEQSAKSLRGREMADVIFNGSGTRRSVGFAEVTLTFDNARRQLRCDADEVLITRRVYRTGEGEYLINKTPARLRDIRDLLIGSGAGTEAYSIIEQGRVDALLQSSAKDRRAIFEEAAGISRFKAKKIETLRKLEHVDQNLLRLVDIVEEVEKQLRSVKLQAGKARRYQELSERLRDLRVRTGLADFDELARRLSTLDGAVTRLQHEVTAQSARATSLEAKELQLNSLIEELDTAIRSREAMLTDTRQEIARFESQISFERVHGRELGGQLERLRGQWSEVSARVLELDRQVARFRTETDRVAGRHVEMQQQVADDQTRLDDLEQEIESLSEQNETERAELLEGLRAQTTIRNAIAACDSQVRTLAAQRQRLESRAQVLSTQANRLREQLELLATQEGTQQAQIDTLRIHLADLRSRREAMLAAQDRRAAQEGDLRAQLASRNSRIDVLGELERRHEGLGAGVQQALALPGAADRVIGLVAELFQVDVSNAALVERALGARAQDLIVHRQADAIAWAEQHRAALRGTVRFLALDVLPAFEAAVDDSPNRRAGMPVLPDGAVPADTLVRVPQALQPVATHLLGRTYVVDDLATAARLARDTAARDRPESACRFLTRQGDLVEADGSVTTGAAHAGAGLISRKSELRELREQVAELARQRTELEQDTAAAEHLLAALDTERAAAEQQSAADTDAITQLRQEISTRRQQLAGLDDELAVSHNEIRLIDRDLGESQQQKALAESQLAEHAAAQQFREQGIADRESLIDERMADRNQRRDELTAAKVELAKTAERLANLRQRLDLLDGQLAQGKNTVRDTLDQICQARLAEQDSQRKTLRASSQIALLYTRKESLARQIVQLVQQREAYRGERHTVGNDAHDAREKLQGMQADWHNSQLQANDVRHQQATLADRLAEDYGADLRALHAGYQPDPTLDRAAVDQEVHELRRKIAGLGNVNLDALRELEELEGRAKMLAEQRDDLIHAKAALEVIIHKIDGDSRRLFSETLDTVRAHFGELFRKLFGGGKADIVLEDPDNVLESGIEIMARPPGKEPRSISLLSGGEKTMTTVALLLAVFRSKPSPFCILDEVDAALDEANVERFTGALRDFLDQSQFIMITHCKKTMLCADALYGVTMQESGVSKRISVRLEDVNDKGEISRAALERSERDEPAPEATEPEGDQAAA
jgi:chromosome segregation protein